MARHTYTHAHIRPTTDTRATLPTSMQVTPTSLAATSQQYAAANSTHPQPAPCVPPLARYRLWYAAAEPQ